MATGQSLDNLRPQSGEAGSATGVKWNLRAQTPYTWRKMKDGFQIVDLWGDSLRLGISGKTLAFEWNKCKSVERGVWSSAYIGT